jgi:20S proteasome alpha/beta subunit
MKGTVAVILQSLLALTMLTQPLLCSSWQAEGRYSFSLTTFDPTGKLGQVERAMEAAVQGTPIVGLIVKNNTIIMAAPQLLPSPLMQDDGTRRFSQLTDEICIAHSGIAADGRVLVAEAHRIAVEYQYTFDEPAPLPYLLEELAQIFQQYTMKPGSRPFGTSLLIGFNPRDRSSSEVPCFYRIDPSGAVTTLGECAVIHGELGTTDVRERLQEVAAEQEMEQKIADVLRSTLMEQAFKKRQSDDVTMTERLTIMTAKAFEGRLSVHCHFNN